MKLKYPIGIDIAYNNATTKYNPITGKDEEFPPDWSVPITPMPDFVICKASQGNVIEDFTFSSNWKQLGERGILRGAYHYYDYRYGTSGSQAKFFVDVIKKAGGIKSGDVLVLDEEQEGHLSATAIVDFLYNVEVLTGIRPVIYSRTLLLNGLNLSKLTATQKQYIKETKLWIAGTFNDKDAVDGYSQPPSMFIPDQSRYGQVVMWQYGLDVNPVGLMSGLPGGLDFNWIEPVFYETWKSKTTGTGVPEVPPEGDTVIVIKPYSAGTRLRTDHNTFSSVISSYGSADVIEGDSIWVAPANGSEVVAGDKWLHVTKINGNAVVGWMAIVHKGLGISAIISQTEEPPPPDEVTLTHTIEVFSDGSLKIDGLSYS